MEFNTEPFLWSNEQMPRLQSRWEFGYSELAKLCEVKEGTIRQHVHRGTLVPGDLVSVFTFVAQFGRPEVKQEILSAVTRTGAYGYGCETGPKKNARKLKQKIPKTQG